jgi:hypothetical protein
MFAGACDACRRLATTRATLGGHRAHAGGAAIAANVDASSCAAAAAGWRIVADGSSGGNRAGTIGVGVVGAAIAGDVTSVVACACAS